MCAANCFAMVEDINNEVLIPIIEANPVLWDKTLDEYKEKNATKEAWNLVCCQLKEDFNEMESRDKMVYCKAVMKRWTNLRDAFYKSKRKSEDCTINQGKKKRYVYSDQMQFLNKLYESRETADSLFFFDDGLNDDRNLELRVMEQQSLSETHVGNTQKGLVSRKRSHPDKIKMSTTVETPPQNSHMCFFQGILPHLKRFDENEVLEFQMGVLQVISRINEKKRNIQPP